MLVRGLFIPIVVSLCMANTCFSFAPIVTTKQSKNVSAIRLNAQSTHHDGVCNSRREVFGKFASILTVGAVSTFLNVRPAEAADGATIWNTGKAPKVPGQKPKDKSDVSGTRKDPSFLRSLSDCKSKCENTAGPDGLSKSKEDCLSECQDICCTTYEQCTFSITPRY
mmetsp:Transcript_20642/g.28711  ORF Transcript_20642/g.28711 Transcript_20642/m.28711 type:complete len:167 (-) Transcript_20642:1190-1690(-)